jgi:histidyl-tRNA synthetase
MPKFQAVRGTKDILPEEAALFERLESEARSLFRRFGYQEIRTPTFEALDLFQRSLGESTDVVQKEMYVFEDRGGRKLALRPEGTAGVARAFVEHHLSQTHPFCKLFYMGPMFRAERPQAGRYREFWQIGAEYFGNASPAADAEILLLVQRLFQTMGVPDARLKVNSLGCGDCRPRYLAALLKFLETQMKNLCEDCRRRARQNPLRALDCKTDAGKLASAPAIDAFWCMNCRAHFASVQELFKQAGGSFEVVPRLVRGLDYYTRTIFEVVSSALGAQDALAAGGRYDRLIKDLGGPDVPALGFALGVERTLQALQAASKKEVVKSTDSVYIFVAALGEPAAVEAFRLLQELRQNADLAKAGIMIEGGFFDKKLGAQLGIADRIAATHCVIIGEDEMGKNEVTLRAMKSGAQERIAISQIASHVLRLARA